MGTIEGDFQRLIRNSSGIIRRKDVIIALYSIGVDTIPQELNKLLNEEGIDGHLRSFFEKHHISYVELSDKLTYFRQMKTLKRWDGDKFPLLNRYEYFRNNRNIENMSGFKLFVIMCIRCAASRTPSHGLPVRRLSSIIVKPRMRKMP